MTPELQDHVVSDFRRAAAEQALFDDEPHGSMTEILHATDAEIATAGPDASNLPNFSDIAETIGQLEEVLPPDHPDFVNLRAAAHQWLEQPELWPQPEDFGVTPRPSKLGVGDPYELADGQEVEQTSYSPDTGLHQAVYEQSITQIAESQMGPEPMAKALDTIHDACEQQFDQGLEAIVHEAIPEQDPFELQQQMYDEQMEKLMNPFMTPGPTGPFGPMPGM